MYGYWIKECKFLFEILVCLAGFEPARPKTLDFKSKASTISAKGTYFILKFGGSAWVRTKDDAVMSHTL